MELLLQFFPQITPEQLEQYIHFKDLLFHWNEKINLISRKDIDSFDEKHLLHSLSIAHFYHFTPNSKIIDVGAGGGFPGLPLAIFFPKVEFILLDSIQKKINVLSDIILQLKLKNVKAVCQRSEQYSGVFDFVLGRAVTALPQFVKQTEHLIAKESKNEIPNGIIYLKGGEFKEEIQELNKNYPRLVVEQNYLQELFPFSFFETKMILYLHLK